MRPKTLLVQLVLFNIITMIGIGSGEKGFAKPSSDLTEKDKLQIVESVLRRESHKPKSVQENGRILLARTNIPQNATPKLNGHEIVLIDTDEITSQSGTQEGISYFVFSKIEVQGSKIIVYFGHYRQSTRDAESSGSTYEYKKVSNKWKGKLTGGFGSAN